MSKATIKLIKIVEKKGGEQDSWSKAQELLNQGADIKVSTNNGSMIDSVIGQEQRFRIARPWHADNCLRLIDILKKSASDQLAGQVFSPNGSNIDEMHKLVELKGSCYQSETYGPLGLLGSLLNQNQIPIRLDVVQFLVENDSHTKYSLTTVDDQQQTCLSLAKKNPNCPKDVINYIQQQFDMILNQIPFTNPQMNINEIIEWIRHDANKESTDKYGNTVLSNAVIANNLELVRILVSIGSNTLHTNKKGLTPLQLAKEAPIRNPQLIKILDVQGVNVKLIDLIKQEKSELTIEGINNFLQNGANINATLTNNDSFLHILIVNDGTPQMITNFVNDLNADISATNINGYRPIETCIIQDKHPYTRLLTFFKLSKMTTDFFINSKLNKTLLQFAIEQKRSEAAKIIQDELNLRLWNCVTRTNTNETNNKTLIDEIKQLINYGAQINSKHKNDMYQGWTILHLTCKTNIKSLVQYLIEDGKADYMIQNPNGDYPISVAAEYGHLEIVEYLRDLSNSNLNVFNKDQQTPLHLATKNHHLLVVRYLVKWGADHQARNSSKQTPLDIARTNVSKNKNEEINDHKLIQFLEQLICPSVNNLDKQSINTRKATYDFDTCELVTPIDINPIEVQNEDGEGALGITSKGFLQGNPNNNLHDAAKNGFIFAAQQAIGQGANIRHRRDGYNPYELAQISAQKCLTKLNLPNLTLENRTTQQNKLAGCQQIAYIIQQIAQQKLLAAIDQSNAGLVMAYHLAGSPLTTDLLHRACTTSDNVEIIDYLINQSIEIYQSLINYSSHDSLYKSAKKRKLTKVAYYLKYRLSVECTKAIKENNLELVKKLVDSGASVDMHNTNNLQEALQHQNFEMIKFLCHNGAKMPYEWLNAKSITLPSTVSQQLKPEIKFLINRYLIDRRLRFSAASGDLDSMIQCQHLGADINSVNCHGSTALLCTIQHGNYFSIVHALVSSGASMLHSNDNEPRSLIDIARKKNYKQISAYLSNELNIQFISSILNNDRTSAEKFAELGADLNYQDEQKRTALHYAVQYHDIHLITWLCDCGSNTALPDINGDYPLMIATEKGNYTIVEYFVTKHPGTKSQRNKDSLTALQIAEKLGYSRIAYVLEHGKAAPDSLKDEQENTDEELTQASRNGPIEIIHEFIKQRYESREKKKLLCEKMIKVAREANQWQIVEDLERYYNADLGKDGDSDVRQRDGFSLSKKYQGVLLGLLGGLSSLITGSPVVLDPNDPNTYKNLFSSLNSNVAKQVQELQQVTNDKDVKKLIEQDSAHTKEELIKIDEALEEYSEKTNSLQRHINDIDQRLFNIQKQNKGTALERKELMEERESYKKQFSAFECTMILYKRQQETILIRQNTMNFIKENTNLALFYRTIENSLHALLYSILSAQGGYVKRETTLPFMSIIMSNIKSSMNPVLSKLNEKEQKQEWHNISTLGNIEELRRIASDTAGMITLYYKEQIQSIDPFEKIKATNILNTKIKRIKDSYYNVRPENFEEISIVMIAEYITNWIIDALKAGQNEINPLKPLPQQFWLYVAKKNPFDQRTTSRVTDRIGLSDGEQKISLKTKDSFGNDTKVSVQVRHLIGCVSVVETDGRIYQYVVPKNSPYNELNNLDIFGYVYVTPFSSDIEALHSIVDGRKLQPAKYDTNGDILTKCQEIMKYAEAYNYRDGEHLGESSITKETARQVAKVLHEEKIFIDPKDLQNQLKTEHEKIEINIDILREDIQSKQIFYQTSIDAIHEQVKQESIINRETMKKDNELHYNQLSQNLNEQLKDIEKYLHHLFQRRINAIEQKLRQTTEDIRTIAETAKVQSLQAISEANQANQISIKSSQQAAQAAATAHNLVESTEQRRKELQLTVNNCEMTMKQTAVAQEEFSKRMIMEMRTKMESDIQNAKETVRESATSAKESARIAKESTQYVQDIQKTTKNQLELQKKEIEKTLAEAKEVRQYSERAADEAKEAGKHARRAADTGTAALDKVNNIQEHVNKTLEQIEKIKRRLQ